MAESQFFTAALLFLFFFFKEMHLLSIKLKGTFNNGLIK